MGRAQGPLGLGELEVIDRYWRAANYLSVGQIVDGHQVEGTWRAHQVPLANVRGNPEHLAQLDGRCPSVRGGGAADPDAAGHHGVVKAQHWPVVDPSRRDEPATNPTFDDGDAWTPRCV